MDGTSVSLIRDVTLPATDPTLNMGSLGLRGPLRAYLYLPLTESPLLLTTQRVGDA